jgi:hypothetical protein
MVIVLVFIVLFFSLWSVAYRQTAAALRVESVQSNRVVRDEGSTQAVARGLALLETGLPPSNPYACSVTVTTSSGPRSFTVTFTAEGPTQWSVQSVPAAPGMNLPPMPRMFAAVSPLGP